MAGETISALEKTTVLHRYKTLAGIARSGFGSEVTEKSLVILMPPSEVSLSPTVLARIAVVFIWTYGSNLRFIEALEFSANSLGPVGFCVAGFDLLRSSRVTPSRPGRSLSINGLRCIKDAHIKPEQYSIAIQFLVDTIYQKGSAQNIAAGVDADNRTISETQGLDLSQLRDL